MVQIDRSDARRVVAELSKASQEFERQFILWLGIGSAGGAVALLTFSANLPDPDRAFRALLPSLSAFAVGVVSAAGSVLAISRRESHTAHHHGQAYNRDELGAAIRSLPEFFASHQHVADEMNSEREKLISSNHQAHSHAELAWTSRTRWNRAYVVVTTISALGFAGGIAWPIGFMVAGGHFAADSPRSTSTSHKKASLKSPRDGVVAITPGNIAGR